ncbi:hypothetical protein [Pseudoalteromonas sp. MMG005]|uniref:hypothetical protein n=1 Tax=Pseudoalteromonas sp. MMG005 TaxID=2822682 RepID=UPI001B3A0C95|nr:hypothetical protein [Pseudoalteromonas sp. MMG005]MBQ4845739.1 hypothetical protein [Pseudoalteromonas sp. MMG005]
MTLDNVVAIYRALGCPEIQRRQFFSGEFVATEETSVAFDALLSNEGGGPARVTEADCDGVDLILNNHDITVGSKITAKVRLAGNSLEKFYASYGDFLSSSSIKQGMVPANFYIIEGDDFFSSEGNIDNETRLEQFNALCEVIRGLQELAHYHDKDVVDDQNKLVFLSAEENKSCPVVLDICLREEMLTADLSDISVLTSLLSDEAKLEAHYEPRKSIFYSSLVEFVAGFSPEVAFCKLVENWPDFTDVYQKNHSTYLSGFAFHKAKKEVAESEIKLAEQLSKVTSELTGKLFSIPVSVAAIVAMFHKDSTLVTNMLVVLGLVLTAILIVGVVINQRNQLESVKQAKEIVEQSIEGKKSSYPDELNDHIDRMSRRLDDNIATAGRWLFIFRTLAWVPALIAVVVFYAQYSNGALIQNAIRSYGILGSMVEIFWSWAVSLL